MSALQAKVTSGSVALVAATAKTVLQLAAPTNQRVKVQSLKLTTDGVTSSAVPVAIRLIRQTSAGTMTAVTPIPVEPELTETIQTTAAKNASAEPANAGKVLDSFTIPAFMGGYEVFYPFGQELVLDGGGRLGVEATAPANVNIYASLQFEE